MYDMYVCMYSIWCLSSTLVRVGSRFVVGAGGQAQEGGVDQVRFGFVGLFFCGIVGRYRV